MKPPAPFCAVFASTSGVNLKVEVVDDGFELSIESSGMFSGGRSEIDMIIEMLEHARVNMLRRAKAGGGGQ